MHACLAACLAASMNDVEREKVKLTSAVGAGYVGTSIPLSLVSHVHDSAPLGSGSCWLIRGTWLYRR